MNTIPESDFPPPFPTAGPMSAEQEARFWSAPDGEAPGHGGEKPSRAWMWFLYGREELGAEDDREFVATACWLFRSGGLLLLLGLGYLVYYVHDRLLPEVQFAGLLALGVGMTALSLAIWQTRFAPMARVLITLGASVLFFMALTLDRFFEPDPPEWVGFAWSCGVSVVFLVIALLRDSRLIAVLGTLGFLVAPGIIPGLEMANSHALMATYLCVLVWLMWGSRRVKTWMLPTWIAVSGVLGWWMALWWRGTPPTCEPQLWSGATLMVLLVAHMAVQCAFWRREQPASLSELGLATLSATAISVFFFWSAWVWKFDMARPAWIAAGAFVLLATLLRPGDENRLFRALNLGLGVLFLMLGILTASHNLELVAVLLFVECLILQFLAHRLPSNTTAWLVRIATALLTAGWFLLMCSGYFDGVESGDWLKMWYQRALLFGGPVICLLLMALDAEWAAERPELPGSGEIAALFSVLGVVLLMTYLAFEAWYVTGLSAVPEMFRSAPSAFRLCMISVVWVLAAVGLLALGIRWKVRHIRCSALCSIAAAILLFVANLLMYLRSWSPWCTISALIVFGILVLIGGGLYLKHVKT